MPLFGGPPNVEGLHSKRDFPGLLKAAQYRKDDALRARAIDAAIDLAITESGSHEPQAVVFARIEDLLTALVSDAQQGDELAFNTLIRIVSREFLDRGIPHYRGRLETRTQELLASRIGSPAVGPLLALLDHPNDIVQWQVPTILGSIGDPAALKDLVAKALRTEPAGMGSTIRQSCGVAVMNLFPKDRERFVEIAKTLGLEEREFIASMVGYRGAGVGGSSIDDTAGDAAREIYPERYPTPTPKQQAANERGDRERDKKDRARRAMEEAEARRKAEGHERPKLP
ncbi:MAG: hypothetical protein WD770_03805 [Actinomycetota bacterium]